MHDQTDEPTGVGVPDIRLDVAPERPTQGARFGTPNMDRPLTFEVTTSYLVKLSRTQIASIRNHMVAEAKESGEEYPSPDWYSDQDCIERAVRDWIAFGHGVGYVEQIDTVVWSAA